MSTVSQAVLLVNLGSPDSPSVRDVRRYLAEFLMDKRVLDVPWLLRALVVYGAILPRRPAQSAKAYATIWTNEGSPLVTMSQTVQTLLQQKTAYPVGLAMRYGHLSIAKEITRLLAAYPALTRLMLLPLYPHYAMSSYETVVCRVQEELARQVRSIQLTVIPPFYQNPGYIQVLKTMIQEEWVQHPWDHLLFSYHGIPERHIKKADPTQQHCLTQASCCNTASPAHDTCYRHQCFQSTRLVMAGGDVPYSHSISFQSRLGKDPWLKPYTDMEVVRLAQSGVKRLAIICPAFVSDCLETLEEIKDRARHDFLDAGGEDFVYIPCLNDRPDWIEVLGDCLR